MADRSVWSACRALMATALYATVVSVIARSGTGLGELHRALADALRIPHAATPDRYR